MLTAHRGILGCGKLSLFLLISLFNLAQLALDRHGSQLLTSAHYILGISLTCFPCTPSDSKEQEKAGHGVAGSALVREHN